ncbi:hypothetical protein TPA0910_87080 [Streptomyces hygroscopicus subsp. sporocinereus]|uniref:Uncharacterized protein n=1 Tax=Streptomyces hygroscopicus TaxID=1912 RepID=A0ABQ3UFA6_STRHY|nr:hypothetical protein [Streptomyces hygroscopicus]GHJ34275.1 hypothetical protein TPA0910_87080 [Streptomyces hygroscopicus]
MSDGMTAEQRGDFVEALMPVAAGLAMAVREETPAEVKARLHELDRHELEAVAVVLAAMVDPDRPLIDALGWVDFDEHGEPLKGPQKSRRTVGSLARAQIVDRTQGVDRVAVERALNGERFQLNQHERTIGVDLGIRRGMSYDDVADRLGMTREAVQRSWDRSKKQARANGQYVPLQPVGQIAA